nr:hypothetical protein [uncultured Mediterranean phage uvMED]
MALVKYNNNSISAVTSASSIPSGALTHIKTLTASSSATLSFVDGSSGVVLDSTYPIYKFEFINMHPASNDADFQFNLSADSGSNYNVTKTTTAFNAYHYENDSSGAGLSYDTSIDSAQSTSDQILFGNQGVGNDNDQSLSGSLVLFNPSSTTFVKHFMTNVNGAHHADISANTRIAGYGNTTSAIDGVRFKFASGNIDSGKIKLYGIKDS